MNHWFSDATAFRRDPLQFLLERAAEYSPGLAPLALGPKRHFLVTDPDLARKILKADEDLIDKGALVRKLRPLTGDSFITMSGTDYRARREVLHERFATGTAGSFVPPMAAVIRHAAMVLLKEKDFNAHEVTAPLALNLVCVALFGHDVLSSGDKAALVGSLQMIEDEVADEMFRVLPASPWKYWACRQKRKAAREAFSLVVNRVRERAGASSVLRALSDLGLNDDEIRDELVTMLLAGHHTTGTAATWLLYHLARRPDITHCIGQEAAEISDENGEIRPDQLKNATVSLALVREVLRLYPSAWWFAREVKQNHTLAGVEMKKGAVLIISPWQLHRDPRFWDQPERFDVDRSFSGASYMPFGAGPRTCVGMRIAMLELQLLALEFASTYQLELVGEENVGWPTAALTLIPPEIRLRIQFAEDPEISVAAE